ncbi:MAG TPA: glycosyltransferase family 4 protein [Vicinamibacterales bacterium]|nr:glycosyltransferase family 4 protein [Vicinamibacterales bacterium]
MSTEPSVVYLLPDKMGGTMTVVSNLLEYRKPDGFRYGVVLTHNHLSLDSRAYPTLCCDRQTTVEYTLPIENLHAVMRRVARAIPRGPGVVVASDLVDLATLSVHDVGRAVILILHGDSEYYYELAVKHDRVIHAYVAISRRIYDQLHARLPHRAEDIHYIPFGIPLPSRSRSPVAGPLRLIFAGRLEHGQKGVLDLPAIDARLWQRGVAVTWTIVGDGPDAHKLRALWPESTTVRYLGTLSNPRTIETLADHDVFILPSKTEGLPVALIEAMGTGLVPVVSNLDSGVPDVVTRDVTGLMAEAGDAGAFANAIERLARDRTLLERMSVTGRQMVHERFDVRERTAAYQELYARYVERYRPRASEGVLQYGSRLDRPWIPNPLVRLIRTRLRARPA